MPWYKKKSFIGLIIIGVVALMWAVCLKYSPSGDYELSKPSFENEVDALEYDIFENSDLRKKVLLEEFEQGYIFLGIDNEDCLVIDYYERNKKDKSKFESKSYRCATCRIFVENTDPLKIFKSVLVNFSSYSIYFGCCQSETFKNILVNGEKPNLYNRDITIEGKNYNVNFWFVLSESNPTVELA